MMQQLVLRMVMVLSGVTALYGQSPETPIFQQGAYGKKEAEKAIVERLQLLRNEGGLLSKKQIDKQLTNPVPEPVKLPRVRDKSLRTEEVAAWARATNLRVGYAYVCPRCDDWHFQLAGGYAIAEDVIVTCEHVANVKTAMREGYLIAVDHVGNVAGAVAVLACSEAMDVIILRMKGATFTPVPLNRDVTQGTASYCFSHPLGEKGYFSAGIINRFFRQDTYRGEKEGTLDALRHVRVNFSNDWAPGSSGSALFDQAGNVVGHVSTIAGLSNAKAKAPLITLHIGIPAGCVEALVGALKDPVEIKRIAGSAAKKE